MWISDHTNLTPNFCFDDVLVGLEMNNNRGKADHNEFKVIQDNSDIFSVIK